MTNILKSLQTGLKLAVFTVFSQTTLIYPNLFPDPYSIAPMFFRYPPFNHIKRFKGPPFLHNTQMVITNNIFFTLPFLLTVTSECATYIIVI